MPTQEYDARDYVLVPDEARFVIEALDDFAERYASDPTWTDLRHMTYLSVRARLARLAAYTD